MNANPGQRIVLGRITGPYGVRGWVRIVSFTRPADNILDYRHLELGTGGRWQAVEIAEVRPHGRHYVARLAGCEDRERAQAYAGAELALARERLPPATAGEYYWSDLLGMQVAGADGRRLGTVAGLLETGGHDVLVVEDGARRDLVPFVQGVYVLAVDLAERRIVVDWE